MKDGRMEQRQEEEDVHKEVVVDLVVCLLVFVVWTPRQKKKSFCEGHANFVSVDTF